MLNCLSRQTNYVTRAMISTRNIWFMLYIFSFLLLAGKNATAQLQPLTVSFVFGSEACQFPDAPIRPEGITVSPFSAQNIGCHAGEGHISRLWTTDDSIRADQYMSFVLAAEEGATLSFSEMDTLLIEAFSTSGMKIQPAYVTDNQIFVLGDTTLAGETPPPSYTFPMDASFSTDSLEIRVYAYNSNSSNGQLFINEISLTLQASNIRVGTEDEGSIPHDRFRTPSIYPNPAASTTTISFNVPIAEHARFVIYDLLGREVSRLVDNWLPAGSHQMTWDAATTNAGGVYIYNLQIGNQEVVGTIVVLR